MVVNVTKTSTVATKNSPLVIQVKEHLRLLCCEIMLIKLNQYVSLLALKKLWILAFKFQRNTVLPLYKLLAQHFTERLNLYSSSRLCFAHATYKMTTSINFDSFSLLSLHMLAH